MAGHQGDELAYGGKDFEAASELVRGLAPHRGNPARVACALLLRPRATARAVRTIARLPMLEVALTDTANGQAIRAELEETKGRVPVGRIARAALQLPHDF